MFRLALLLFLSTSFTPAAPGLAQGAATPAPEADLAPGASPVYSLSQEPAPSSTGGLPRAAPPPRTLRAHWHVFIAFAIAWGLLFGYAIALGRRFGTLERRIERLERTGG